MAWPWIASRTFHYCGGCSNQWVNEPPQNYVNFRWWLQSYAQYWCYGITLPTFNARIIVIFRQEEVSMKNVLLTNLSIWILSSIFLEKCDCISFDYGLTRELKEIDVIEKFQTIIWKSNRMELETNSSSLRVVNAWILIIHFFLEMERLTIL